MLAVIFIALIGCVSTRHAYDAQHVVVDVNVNVVGVPAVPAYVSGIDPRLAQLAQYSALYRSNWTGPAAGGGRSYGSAAINLNAKCPEDRDPATQAERDACQELDISSALDQIGTVEVK